MSVMYIRDEAGNFVPIKTIKAKDGVTPERGKDYWTDADQQQIVQDVLSALPTWTGGAY